MNLMERMVEQARENKQRIVLTEYWPTTSPILYSSGNRLKLWNLPIGTS